MIVLLIIIQLVIFPLVYSIELTPIVKIDSGQLQGYVARLKNTGGLKVRGYLGIPFAQAKRFENPEPPEPWNGIKRTTSLGKACPQVLTPLGVTRQEDISEDCLNLNVYVPDGTKSSERLPVMVWIYGGAFMLGSNRLYDGSYIAALGKVVVVAINYRVSVFGFLNNGRYGDIKGNYGMFDQIEALKWVKRNIKAFNGDPNKVTIFGESAGGGSVSLLVLSKLAKGLFQRAIAQSGDASAFWASSTYESRAKTTELFVKNVGCPEELCKLRDCLKRKGTMEIITASLKIQGTYLIPIVDGHFLHDDPMVLYKKQDFEKYDMMMGVTNDEGTVFTDVFANIFGALLGGLNVSNGVPRALFLAFLRGGGLSGVIPNPKSVLINATIQQYTDYTDVSSLTRNRRMYVDLIGDLGFVAPAIRGANAYAKKKAPTYFYSFEHRYGDVFFGVKLQSWVKANHAADVAFVFGSPLRNNPPITTPADAKFTRDIITYWTNFAKTGNPNSPVSVGVTWPEYNLEKQKYMSLKPNMAVNSHLRANKVAYWNWFIPNALRAPCKASRARSSPGDEQEIEIIDEEL